MKFAIYIFFLGVFGFACASSSSEMDISNSNKEKIISNLNDEPICPKGHSDSLIPCIWGMPSEELFDKSDSGLVWLGGCEIPSENPPEWHCKIHNIQF